MDIYEILNRLSSIDNEATRAAVDQLKSLNKIQETTASTSRYEGFKRLEKTIAEGSRPDFLDLDRDGNKSEPMKKAVVGLKGVKEEGPATNQYPFPVKQSNIGTIVDGPAMGEYFLKLAKQAESKPQGMTSKMLRPGVSQTQEKESQAARWLTTAFRQNEMEGAKLINMIKTSPAPEYSQYRDALDSLEVNLKNSGIDLREVVKAALSPQQYFRAKSNPTMAEADMEEGNDFTGARLAAIKAGRPTFSVGGKTFKVTGDTSDEKKMMEKKEKTLWPGTPEYEKQFPKVMKTGEKKRSSTGGEIEKTATGLRHTAKYDDAEGEDDKLDRLKGPKMKGRPKGSKRALGAKGPTGKSKLLSKGAIKEMSDEQEIAAVDHGEYDREGDMAREQLHTVMDAAKELHGILDADENLPEWVQSKITKALDYLDTARDYVKASDAEDEEIAERELTKGEMSKREKYVKSMKKNKEDFKKRYGDRGEEVMYATATKMAKKKKAEESKDEEIEETTTSGSVATAPTGGKSKGIFGKGVYEAEFEQAMNSLMESVSVNISADDQGQKNVSVTATDADAESLSQLLQMAGLFGSGGYQQTCPTCGQAPCACEETVEEDYSNTPEPQVKDTEFMTKDIVGGLNAPKTTGQTTIPVINTNPARQGVAEEADAIKRRLFDLYKKYEG